MTDIYDFLIIGGGAAGCSAAVYAARRRMDTAIVTEEFGGQLLETDSIENYLGFKHLSGQAISEKYEEHVRDYDDQVDIHLTRAERVDKREDGIFEVATNKETFRAHTVLVATGNDPRTLGADGEDEFNNRGISYCVVCDGPLYADEEIAIIGGGYTGTEGALFMSDVAETVYLLNIDDELSGEPITLEKIPEQDNVEVINNAATQEFVGDQMLQGLRYEDTETGETHELAVNGAFIEIGRVPNTAVVDHLALEMTDDGQIISDKHQRTTIDGLYACGDVSDIATEQAILAAGEGAAAALDAGRYVKEKKQD